MSLLVVIDIDATLAHAGRRIAEAGPEPSRDDKDEYKAWVERIQNEESLLTDAPVSGMSALLSRLLYTDVVYLTSREEKWREVTKGWLMQHKFPVHPLYMRPDGDWREGAVFKEDVIKGLVAMRYVSEVVVIDDDGRGDIEEMCHRNGYTFLKARSGGQV